MRERVFVLAASKDQADLFIRRWQTEKPNVRRLQDAIYLHGDTGGLLGHAILATDRIVGVEGYYRHPQAPKIEDWVCRTLAKTGRAFEIEPVTT